MSGVGATCVACCTGGIHGGEVGVGVGVNDSGLFSSGIGGASTRAMVGTGVPFGTVGTIETVCTVAASVGTGSAVSGGGITSVVASTATTGVGVGKKVVGVAVGTAGKGVVDAGGGAVGGVVAVLVGTGGSVASVVAGGVAEG